MLSHIWIYHLYQVALNSNANMIESYQTIRAANQSILSLQEAELGVNYFVLTGDKEAIKKLSENIISTELNIETLHKLTTDDATEIRLFNILKPLIDEQIQLLQKIVSVYQTRNQQAAIQLVRNKDSLLKNKKIYQLIIDFKQIEQGQLEQATPIYALNKYNADRVYILSGIFNVTMLLLIYLYMRRSL
jgi:CHASE3 domain sensor protein